MIRAIVFDMDGLMVNTEHLYWEVAREIAAEHGKSVSDQTLRKTMGRERLASVRIIVEEAGLPLDPEEVMHRRERMMAERLGRGVEPMPGLREILARFHGRLKLAVATSSPRMLVDATLPGLGIDGYFDAITAGDEITRGKPDPEIYLKTVSKLKVDPAACVVLEDAPAGALAGWRAGAYVIAVPSPLTAEEDFSKIAHQRVNNLFEAADIIASMT